MGRASSAQIALAASLCANAWFLWERAVPPDNEPPAVRRLADTPTLTKAVALPGAEGAALTCSPSTRGSVDFYNAALSLAPNVTDKVHALSHGHFYETIYGVFMMPLLQATGGGAGLKLLEIGIGCDYKGKDHTTQAKSVRLWRHLAPKATLWAAEYDQQCVAENEGLWKRLRVNTLVGDQGSNETLQRWVAASGGAYNVVIDDGSHKNHHILASFRALWPQVVPGGLYFLEDLLVGRSARWDETHAKAVISDVVQAWVEQLIIPARYGARAGCFHETSQGDCPDQAAAEHTRAAEMRRRFPMPDDVAFIFCQRYACVLGKKVRPGDGIGWESRRERYFKWQRNRRRKRKEKALAAAEGGGGQNKLYSPDVPVVS